VHHALLALFPPATNRSANRSGVRHGPPVSVGEMHDERRGIASGIAAYLLWGLLTIYWKELHGLPAVQLIAMRVVCSSVLLAAGLSLVRQWPPLFAALRDRRQTRAPLAGRGVPQCELDGPTCGPSAMTV
jgi:hypothetical protein